MRRVLLVLALFLCGTVGAFAQSQEYQFLAFSGGDWTNGYPYYIEPVDGPSTLIYAVMCDDYTHGGQPGDVWDANLTNLGSGVIVNTRFNNLAGPASNYAIGLYDEAGWILLQTQTQQSSEWKAMTYAVWHIFDRNSPLFGDAATWLNLAAAEKQIGFPGVDFGKVYILTPVDQRDPDPNSMQEFMYIGTDPTQQGTQANQTTPEPGTFLLLGSGVLAMLGKKFWN